MSLQIANEHNGSLTFSGVSDTDGDGIVDVKADGLNLDVKISTVELANTTVTFDADSFDVAYYESNEKGEQLGSVSAVKDPGYYPRRRDRQGRLRRPERRRPHQRQARRLPDVHRLRGQPERRS